MARSWTQSDLPSPWQSDTLLERFRAKLAILVLPDKIASALSGDPKEPGRQFGQRGGSLREIRDGVLRTVTRN